MEAEVETTTHGRLQVKTVRFRSAGDKLARHTHLGSGHLSFLLKGIVVSRITGYDAITLTAPAHMYWPIGTEHEWECIEGPATLINVFAA